MHVPMPDIVDISISPKGSRPVIVDFEHGKLQPQYENNLRGQIYKSTEKEILVGIETEKMLYMGNVEEDVIHNDYIMVHNKKTGKIRVLQVDKSIASPVVYKKQNILSSPVASDRLSSVADLHKQFGSKATKRLTEQRERLTMNIDAVKDQLEKTVSDVQINESAMDQSVSENTSIYRPKINRDASTVDDVYLLDDLVPSHILSTLNEAASDVMHTGDLSNFGGFVAGNIGSILRSNASEEVMKKNISIFLYIDNLIKFMNIPVKNITKKFVACDKSVEVSNHILDTFSVNSPHGRMRPIHMKDKSLCYIIVLSAKVTNEVDLTVLTKDLKVGVKKALEIARMLAFSVSTKDKNIVLLKLPLPAPVTFTPKKKR